MIKPLFYVDLSEDDRDYRHTALEPGLPLLDRQGVNFQILRKWQGDLVAEPEWRNPDTVAFYMVDEEFVCMIKFYYFYIIYIPQLRKSMCNYINDAFA